jgi:hypothetical protein
MNIPSETHAEYVASSYAANLWNVLPGIFKLPCVEGFERLVTHFQAALAAFSEGRGFGRVPEPSEN